MKATAFHKERGQALAETALVSIFLLLLLSVIVDGGRLMFTWLALQNAAAEGAYYASAFPNRVGTVGTTNKDTITYRVQHESPSVLLNWTKPGVSVGVTPPSGAVLGTIITVRITYPMEFIGPLPGLLGFSNFPISATASQVVLNPNN